MLFQVVVMTISLAETLVKNCGQRVHAAINEVVMYVKNIFMILSQPYETLIAIYSLLLQDDSEFKWFTVEFTPRNKLFLGKFYERNG